jgi:superfamily II DNA or RNA helicase
MNEIILEVDRREAQIIGEFPFGKVSKELSFHPPGYQFMQAFQRGHWDGRIRFMKKNKRIPAGLVSRLQKFLISLDYQVKIQYTYPLPPTFKKENIRTDLKDTSGRAYQLNACMKAINLRRGIIKLPTGSGKTVIAALIISNLMRPTVFLTHRKEIMHQTYERFVHEFGRNNVSRLGDGLKGKPRLITVGMIPTLERMPVKKRADILSDRECLIADEVHMAKSKSWNKVVNACPAIWRIGLSATPKEGGMIMALEAHTGPIIFDAKAQDLAKKGYLTLPEIVLSRIAEPKISERYDYDQAYRMGIIDNDRRNRRIALMAKLLVAKGWGPTIVFSTKLDHIENMQYYADEFSLNYAILTGKDSSKNRKKEIERLKAGTLDVLFVSTIFDEGVDIPNMGSGIMAGVGKSQAKLIQRMGRTMRPAPGKEKVIIIDFWDDTCRYLLNHSKKRRAVYKREKYPVFTGSLKKYLLDQ